LFKCFELLSEKTEIIFPTLKLEITDGNKVTPLGTELHALRRLVLPL